MFTIVAGPGARVIDHVGYAEIYDMSNNPGARLVAATCGHVSDLRCVTSHLPIACAGRWNRSMHGAIRRIAAALR